MIKSLSRYHNINYTVVSIKYNRYIINIKSFLRVKTGDFPFIIKDLRQKLSIGFDNSHAKKGLPYPTPRKNFWDSHTIIYTVKRINNPSNFKYLPPYFTNG
jgi:hypothetical protein